MSQDHYSLIYTGRKKTGQKHKPKQINPTLHNMPIKKIFFHRLKKKKKRNFTYKVPTKSNAYWFNIVVNCCCSFQDKTFFCEVQLKEL